MDEMNESERESRIDIAEFERSLARICLQIGQRVPSKVRHQHILFAAITLAFESDRSYSETEVNDLVIHWLSEIGIRLEIDHVSLRRCLVDRGYLVRDLGGLAYRVDSHWPVRLFEPGIMKVDPKRVVTEAASERERHKRSYLGGDRQDPGV